MRALKITLYAVAAIVAVLALAIAAFALTFDPNRYKPEIVKLVQDRTGRTLSIDGDIGVALFPRIGATIGRASLSEPGSAKVFAKIERARVALAVMPLLARRVVVDRVELAGLDVELVKHKDGSTNFDDLTGAKAGKPAGPTPGPAPETGAAPPALDISGVSLQNAVIGWRDEAGGMQVQLLGLNLTTGRIADDVPGRLTLGARVVGMQPKLAVTVTAATDYRLNFTIGAAAFKQLDIKVTGELPGISGLEATLKGDASVDPVAKSVAVAGIAIDAKYAGGAVRARLADARGSGALIELPALTLEANLRTGGLGVVGKLQTPVRLALAAKRAELGRVAGNFVLSGPSLPVAELKLALEGAGALDWGKEHAGVDLTARFDESTVKAKLDLEGFTRRAITFDIDADRLNVDRYRGAPAAKGAPAAAASPGPASAEKPLDLAVLKGVTATGKAHIGALVVANLKAENVRAAVKLAGGRLDLAPVGANLYSGALAANVSVNANSNSFAIQQQLTNVAIGPLLRDAIAKDLLEGRGNVSADLTTTGATVGALKRALAGSANIVLRDGAIKGINLAEIARQARALRKGGVETMAAVQTEKTDFSEMTASFAIRNGVAHNEDLNLKSPFVRVGGAGDIDIGAGSMQYLARAAVVASSTGQDGKDNAKVRGITVPVKVSGAFDSLRYQVDFQSMVTDAAKDEVRRRVEDALKDKVDERLKGRIGDQLRGLFGR